MAIDPRQMILQMMMQQGGGMPQEEPPPDQMANMMRNMDPTSVRQRPSESGGGGGGGAPWGRSRPPMSAPPAMGPSMPPQGGPQGVPAHPYEGMSQGYPEQELMDDTSSGLPPEVMELAAQGIGPQQFAAMTQQGGGPMKRKPDRASDEEDVDPMEAYGAPGDEKDPRFGPQEDRLRDDTEREIDDVRQNMGRREVNEIAEEIRNAINDNDQAAYKELMNELEETGIDPDELPPDIQKMMEENDADDDERGSNEPVQDA